MTAVKSRKRQKPSARFLKASEGGYGKPLGAHAAANLVGLLKIKLKRSGIRIVYKLVQDRDHMLIIVIGLRSDSAVYKIAARRIAKLDDSESL